MGRKNKTRKTLAQTKDQTPLLSLSGTRKVVRTPTNPFEVTGTVEVFVPKEIISRRIQRTCPWATPVFNTIRLSVSVSPFSRTVSLTYSCF